MLRLTGMLLLLLLGGLSPLQGFAAEANPADGSTAGSNEQAQPESGGADQQQAGTDAAQADDEQTDEEEEESPSRFIPTEQISQDLGVSFPVDI